MNIDKHIIFSNPHRCSSCGLTSTYPESDFKNNTCKYCREFNSKTFLGESALLEKLGSEKIGVTVSGGKDSLYVWYWLVSKLGSDRVVAFNHSKGQASNSIAIENINRAKKILKTPVIIVNDTIFYDRFIKNLSTYINHPNPAIARAVLCSGCRYGISEMLFLEAEKLGIKKIVNGSSYLEKAPFKAYKMKVFGNGSEERGLLLGLSECDEYLTKSNLEIIIRDHFYCHEKNLSNNKNKFNIDYINFFDFIENDINEIKQLVINRLDWKFPSKSDWHFDCIVEQFKDFFYLLEYGYTEVDFKNSEMVRYGLLTRDESIVSIQNSHKKIIETSSDLLNLIISLNFDNQTISKFKNMIVKLQNHYNI